MIRGFVVLFALLVVAGCQARTSVAVTMTSNGSGMVAVSLVLDGAAAQRIGDVRSALRVADLERTGWTVSVAPSPDGAVTATIHQAFANPAQANALLGQLGPVHLTVRHHHGLISSGSTVSGDVDLRSVDVYSDPAMARALGGTLSSVVQQLQASGGTLPDLRTVILLHLPGHPAHVGGGGSVSGDTVTWTVPLGQQVAVAASSSTGDTVALLYFGIALAGVAALGVMLARGTRRRIIPPGDAHRDQWSLPRPRRPARR